MTTKFYSALPAAWIMILSFVVATNIAYASTQGGIKLDLDKFTGITVGGSFAVFVEQGNRQDVRVEGPQELIEKLNTTVKDGKWNIGLKKNQSKGWYKNQDKLKIYITIPTLDYVSMAGSGNVKVSEFKTADVTIKLSGSGDMDLFLKGNDMTCSLAGSGNIDLKGSADKVDYKLAGSGNINAANMKAAHCEASISGSGNIKLHASTDLVAKIAGSGNIMYSGSPDVSKKVTGSGRIASM